MSSSYDIHEMQDTLKKHLSDNIKDYDIEFLIKIFEILQLEKNSNVKVEKLDRLIDELSNEEDPKKILLVCNILINNSKSFLGITNSYLWRWYYSRGKKHCNLNMYTQAIKDIESSIRYIEKEEDSEIKYTHSLWALAYTYSKMGNKIEAIGIYKKLSKCYKELECPIYRIACLYNIATILNNDKKKKTLRSMLSENSFYEEERCISHKSDILNKMDKKE